MRGNRGRRTVPNTRTQAIESRWARTTLCRIERLRVVGVNAQKENGADLKDAKALLDELKN